MRRRGLLPREVATLARPTCELTQRQRATHQDNFAEVECAGPEGILDMCATVGHKQLNRHLRRNIQYVLGRHALYSGPRCLVGERCCVQGCMRACQLL
jgi:hypothetical protein